MLFYGNLRPSFTCSYQKIIQVELTNVTRKLAYHIMNIYFKTIKLLIHFILSSMWICNLKLGYINFWVSLIREVGCWLVEPFCVYDGCLCITSAWGLPFGLCGVFLLGNLLDGCY